MAPHIDEAATVLAHTQDVLLHFGPDGTLLWASPSLRSVLGFRPDDVVGTDFRFSSIEERDGVRDWVTTGLQDGATDIRRRILAARADGTTVWVEARFSPIESEQGDPSVVVSLRDVQDQVETEELLRRSEADYRLLAENSEDIVFRADVEHHLEWVSPSVTAMLGWQPEELLGRVPLVYVHPDDGAALIAAEDELRRTGSCRFDVRVRGRNGQHRWVNARVAEVRSPEGVVGRIGSARLSDREHHTRSLLERSEQRLKATVDTLLDPHVMLQAIRDDSGRIIDFMYADANEAACEYNGLQYQELVGKRLLDLLPGQGAGGMFDAYCRVIETGEPLIMDEYAYDQDLPELKGQVRLYDIRVVRVEDSLSYTWRDVTERTQAQRALASSEERFRLAVAAVPFGIAVLDLTESFVEVNPALSRLLGRDAPWLLAHRLEHVLVPGELNRFRQARSALLSGAATVQELDQRFLSASGDMVRLDHRITLARDVDGTPSSFVCQFIDRAAWLADDGPGSVDDLAPRCRLLVVTGSEGAFAGLATSALLEQDRRLSILPPAVFAELPDRLRSDEPDVVLAVTAPGPSGTGELQDLIAGVAEHPSVGLVVMSSTPQRDVQQFVAELDRPVAWLNIASTPDASVLSQAVSSVREGLVTIDLSDSRAGDGTGERLADLTDRERDVLELLSRGLDNSAIADDLCVTTKAVENYVGSIFRKLGLNDETGTHKRLRAALMYLGAV